MSKFKVGDVVELTNLFSCDRTRGLQIGDRFTVENVEEQGTGFSVMIDGVKVYMDNDQVKLVKIDDKGAHREQNYVQVAIGHLEEDLLLAQQKLKDHKEAVEKAEQLIRDKEWIEADIEDEIKAIDDAIYALRKV